MVQAETESVVGGNKVYSYKDIGGYWKLVLLSILDFNSWVELSEVISPYTTSIPTVQFSIIQFPLNSILSISAKSQRSRIVLTAQYLNLF